jgi:hypothetical protein
MANWKEPGLPRQIIVPTLHKEAENAERHADQATDESVREILRKAAEDYRHEAEEDD